MANSLTDKQSSALCLTKLYIFPASEYPQLKFLFQPDGSYYSLNINHNASYFILFLQKMTEVKDCANQWTAVICLKDTFLYNGTNYLRQVNVGQNSTIQYHKT